MFDLFRKEEINSLKTRITDLEDENRKLSLQLEKTSEKAKKTIATKQDVDRELNDARNRISSLLNELQSLKKEASQEFRFRFSESLHANRLFDIIYSIDGFRSKTSTLITVYLKTNIQLVDVVRDNLNLFDGQTSNLIDKIESPTGKIILYDPNRIINLVISPALPILRSEFILGKQFDLETLKKTLEYDRIMIISAHAGETIIGIVEADSFVEHETIRTSVMGKHKQGGWSQKRFQSLVEEDVKHHSDKVRNAIAAMVLKYKDIEYVIASGEAKLIKMILAGYNYPLILKSMDTISNSDQVLREAMAARCYWL